MLDDDFNMDVDDEDTECIFAGIYTLKTYEECANSEKKEKLYVWLLFGHLVK